MITGCGNPTWKATHPKALKNAACVDLLLKAGASCLGKTVCDELGFSFSGKNTFYGTPLNVKAPLNVPGGSSSGSASAVANNLVDFSLGTDTAGSVRVPASNCGLYGIRPSYGLSPLKGVTSCSQSFDTIGVFANSYHVLALVSQILFNLEMIHDNTWDKLYLLEDAFDLLSPSIKKAFIPVLEILRKAFPNKIESISLSRICPNTTLEICSETFSILKNIEVWNSFGSWCLDNHFPFSDPIKESFQAIAKIDPGLTSENLILRTQIRKKINTFLGQKNLLCIPTTSEPAPLLTTIREELKKRGYAKKTLQLCSLACIADLCQITIPCFKDRPIGLSFLMSYQNDANLLMLIRTFDNILVKA